MTPSSRGSSPAAPSDAPAASSAAGVEPGPHRLGLPPEGTGSMAPLGRRVAALAVDWACCLLICIGLLRMPYPPIGAQSLLPTLVLLVENVLLVATLGATVGHRLLGLQVVRLGVGPVGFARAAQRSLLLCLVIPAVVWDADGRGFHDRLAGTVIVRR